MKLDERKNDRAQLLWVQIHWQQFWFSPTTPTNLGICRCLFFGYLFWLNFSLDSSPWAAIGPVFWQPTTLFACFHLQTVSGETLQMADNAWKIALVFGCIGFLTPLSTGIAFFLGVYLLGLPQNFGKVDHSTGLLVVILGVLWFSHCGHAWSLDQLVRSRWKPGSPSPASYSGEYRWPIQLARLAMVVVFFGAGTAKLQYGGFGWITATNMRAILLLHHYNIDRELPTLGLILAEHPWLCWLLAVATVGVEVGVPLALISRRCRRVLLPGLFLMQLGIVTLLGVHPHFPFLACYAFWIPWDRLGPGRKWSWLQHLGKDEVST